MAFESSVVTSSLQCFAAVAAAAETVLALQAPLELVSAEGLTRLDLSHRALTGCYHVHGEFSALSLIWP